MHRLKSLKNYYQLLKSKRLPRLLHKDLLRLVCQSNQLMRKQADYIYKSLQDRLPGPGRARQLAYVPFWISKVKTRAQLNQLLILFLQTTFFTQYELIWQELPQCFLPTHLGDNAYLGQKRLKPSVVIHVEAGNIELVALLQAYLPVQITFRVVVYSGYQLGISVLGH